jgi:hypothetical protein
MVAGLQGALLFAVALLAGCAGTQAVATPDPTQRLKERVGQYWDARVNGDQLAAYTLHEPSFRRAVPLTGFLQGRGTTRVLEYEVVGARIEGDLGIVTVKVKSTVVHPKLIKPVEPQWQEWEEQWARVDGEWYRKFRFPVGEPYRAVDWDDLATERSLSEPPSAR